MKNYKEFENFLEDMRKFKENPNDDVFLEAIKDRVEKSSEEVKRKVKDYHIDYLFENKPLLAMQIIMREKPDCFLFIKSKEEPFFEV